MIEMRWVMREMEQASYQAPYFEIWTEKVLQYRQVHQYLGADGNAHPIIQGSAYVWSEWIDVPTVKEK